MKIAFLGIGNMGEPMACRLMKAGHELSLYNRTREKTRWLARAGAQVASSPAEAAAGVEVAITMLADDAAVREALLGGSAGAAAIDVLPFGAVHMGMSTVSVELAKELDGEHAARGQSYVSAPVLGRPEAAAAGELRIMAAGPAEPLKRCRPLMQAMGRGVYELGEEPWQANLAKIAANFMLASLLETMGEAMALVRKSGQEPRRFLEIVNSLFASPVYENYGGMIADERFDPAGFRLKLGLKDIMLALSAAQGAAVPLPLASLIRDHYLSAVAHGRQDADWSALAEVVAQEAGLPSRPAPGRDLAP